MQKYFSQCLSQKYFALPQELVVVSAFTKATEPTAYGGRTAEM